ncbi:hypothetical protein COLO4_23682 [Corchorus olitorius]|uniref:Uncharacterized protein n=1 Tax=Corchorus olitorius TaxID=93759 RepID=A0A1R3IFE1_9ROSI|nr:hypothetical protein COLO4_23682 [Corchorus olitorius]
MATYLCMKILLHIVKVAVAISLLLVFVTSKPPETPVTSTCNPDAYHPDYKCKYPPP